MNLFLSKEENEFFDAIKNGDFEALEYMTERHRVVADTRNIHKANGFHCAARYGQTELMPPLKQFGTYIDGLDRYGRAPIAVAAVFSQPRAVKTFIKLGADVDARGTSKPTALMLAAEINNAEIVHDLIAANGDIHAVCGSGDDQRNAMNFAVDAGNYEIARTLKLAGVSSQFLKEHQLRKIKKSLIISLQEKKFFEAIKKGDTEVFDAIIAAKSVHPDARNHAEANGLHRAARYHQIKMMDTLKTFGTDINGIDWYGHAPITVAAKSGYRDGVQKLISLGADVDARHPAGPTALMLAAEEGYDAIVSDLIAAKADIHAVYGVHDEQRNAVNFALDAGHYEIAKTLTEIGVSTKYLNKMQIEQLDWATKRSAPTRGVRR